MLLSVQTNDKIPKVETPSLCDIKESSLSPAFAGYLVTSISADQLQQDIGTLS